jgi:hypothetical protein
MLRQVSTFVLEILPYALASLIGAFLLAGHLSAQSPRREVRPAAAVPMELAEVDRLSR